MGALGGSLFSRHPVWPVYISGVEVSALPKEIFDHSTFQQEQEYHNIIILYVVFILGRGLSRVLGQQV